MSDQHLSLRDVETAARRIQGRVRLTPVLTSPELDDRVGARVFIKAEGLQRTGSFKVRGAFNKLLSLDTSERQRGVVAYSSGNHAAAVALAARELEMPATVVIPEDAAAPKLAAVEFHGAGLRRYDAAREDRVELASALAHDQGLTLVPPFDDLAVIAGQGTLGLELAEQAPALDVVLVPVGGGGLLAGVGTAVKARNPSVRLIGVEPETGDDTLRSLRAGERIALPEQPQTIADGLRTLTPGAITFPINSKLLDDVVTVTDAQISEAMWSCFNLLRVVVEPSGAVAMAALLSGNLATARQRVGVILSGGNVDAERFADLTTTAQREGCARHTTDVQPSDERAMPASAAGSWRRR